MRKLIAVAGTTLLGLGVHQVANAYSAVATVSFSFGGSSAGSGTDIGWTSGGPNTLAGIANSTYFNTGAGYNSTGYYNSDFATAGDCVIGGTYVPGSALSSSTRKYGCRWKTSGGTDVFTATAVADSGPGGIATGTITVHPGTLTGTLTLSSSTDEPTGATTTFSTSGIRLSNSVGNGLSGYNYRSADGSPFGNSWNGTTTSGTLTLNLTGTFTASTWDITGGAVTFSDPGFACQQGGFGSSSDAAAGILCTRSSTGGGFTPTGGALSWGWDITGAGTGTTVAQEIEVRDAAGIGILGSLSGVLASLSVDGVGNITTTSGEYRRALGSGAGGCTQHIRYDGTKIACGTLTSGALSVTGTATEIPVPAAVWLGASALGLLGAMRRRKTA